MPDITMCNNEDCPKKDSCYRYIATKDIYQPMATFKFGKDTDGNFICLYYWPISNN